MADQPQSDDYAYAYEDVAGQGSSGQSTNQDSQKNSQSNNRDSENYEYSVVVSQPAPTSKPNNDVNATTDDKTESGQDDGEEEEDEDGPAVEVEITPSLEGCISVSAGTGSKTKELCDGATSVEFVGPNVGCEVSCGSIEGCEVVTGCTFELCSCTFMLGLIELTLGLSFDTELTVNPDEVGFEVIGTGFNTESGLTLSVLGSGVTIVSKERRERRERRGRGEAQEEGNGEVNGETNQAIERNTEEEN